jgi:MoaA/NifB/PqqE/SkfB family radical SAM enzyme
MCNRECDHCFVYSSPYARGTFTLSQIRNALNESEKIGSIEWIYFEGGEAFLFYPLMLEGIKLAVERGFKTGIVTNSYWATSEEDAELWLKPLSNLGIKDLSLSDDSFHFEEDKENPAKTALSVANRLGIPVDTICIENPKVDSKTQKNKGDPVVGGRALLKGRAVEKLTESFRKINYKEFNDCPEEELREPKRVHIDPFGYVHICQGLVMGNMWETPLSQLVRNYAPEVHPICGPLLEGGPVMLAKKYGFKHEDTYASACHFCYLTRLSLLDRFPQYLAPRQIYGLE